jgi:protein-S-isoprenylcysteine O-methyltransferase Ste14
MSSDRRIGFGQRILEALTLPWVDKTIAVLAVLPFAVNIFRIIKNGQMNLSRASIVIQFFVIIITMVLRTPPVRVTTNPWYWLLAFGVTYFGLFVAIFAERGTSLLPNVASNAISILALVVAVYARLSLGSSIGFVPAERNIITLGAYRFVRHPIYTGLILSYVGFSLHMFSLRNVIMSLIVIGLIVLKSFIEEDFLRDVPDYADYLGRVRWRWFPGLA